MFSTFSLCLVLVCSLGLTLGQDEQTAAHKPGNVIPVEEWTEEHMDALHKTKKGRGIEEVTAEVESLTRSYVKYVKDNNCGAILNMFDPNYMTTDHKGPVIKGLEAVQYVMASMAEIVSLNASTASVSSLGKNARFVFQHVRVAYNDHEGNFLGNEECFVIWKRHHNGLKAYIEICE